MSVNTTHKLKQDLKAAKVDSEIFIKGLQKGSTSGFCREIYKINFKYIEKHGTLENKEAMFRHYINEGIRKRGLCYDV